MKPGRKRILCVSAILLVGLVALFIWKPWIPSEPVYQGKKLTAWVEQWQTSLHPSTFPPETRKEAASAVRQIGTNGIPFLLCLMRTEEPVLKAWLRDKVPPSWHSRLHLEKTAVQKRTLGTLGMVVLGTKAAPAVPELMELLSLEMNRNPPDPISGHLPLYALASVGSAADPAVPLILQCLTNRNNNIRYAAVSALGEIHSRPETVVPALMKYFETEKLKDINAGISAIQSIGMFRTNASAATSMVARLLTDPYPGCREAATNCLRRINPPVAERAGIRINQSR